MNTQRRIFRGRGGPTDGRLPKHNARRRKQLGGGARKPASNKYHDDVVDANHHLDDEHDEPMDDESISDNDNDVHSEESSEEEKTARIQGEDDPLIQQQQQKQQPASTLSSSETEEPWMSEIKHLKQRLKHVQESIQTSQGIDNPAIYQSNVLNAVENCILEWKAIVNYYHDSAMDLETKREASLQVFGLLQQALQCGPLQGGKPGYFKRCGGTVAKLVLAFLERIAPSSASVALDTDNNCMEETTTNDFLMNQLGFSPKQADAIETWKKNASKAVQADKPPSKSALKKQAGKSKKKKLNKT